jgi:hypothetical protein
VPDERELTRFFRPSHGNRADEDRDFGHVIDQAHHLKQALDLYGGLLLARAIPGLERIQERLSRSHLADTQVCGAVVAPMMPPPTTRSPS